MSGNTAKAYIDEDIDTKLSLSSKISLLNRQYIPQTNGELSESIMQNWTKQAVECYKINSDCPRCSLNGGNYSFICQMPKIITSLLKTYGPPVGFDEE